MVPRYNKMIQFGDKLWNLMTVLSLLIVICLAEGDNQQSADNEIEKRDVLHRDIRVNPKFSHRFVGKRFSSDDDEDIDIERRLSAKFAHRFVGKRLSDVHDGDAEIENEKRAPRFGHRFVGKRYNPKFSHRFVGKRLAGDDDVYNLFQTLDSDDDSEVDKRANPIFSHRFVGKRYSPRFAHRFVGKRLSRALQLRLSPRFGYRFVGKRYNPKFTHRFVGKRNGLSAKDLKDANINEELTLIKNLEENSDKDLMTPELYELVESQLI